MIYFDYAATSLKRKEIFEEVIENFEKFNGNPNSLHSYGRDSRKIMDESRRIISKKLNANFNEIYFTSGASESNNTVLRNFENTKIITTSIEHDSILNSIKNMNFKDVIYVNPNKDGIIDSCDVIKNIDENTKLVCVMFVNNETGAIEPVYEIGDYLKDKKIHFHIDATQALGHFDIDVKKLHCDSLSLSGHKIGGINGFGILYWKGKFSNLIYGGEQEREKRGGTSFVIGSFTMAKAIEKAEKEREHIKKIKNYFLKKLNENKFDYQINGNTEKSSDHILNLYLPWVSTEFLLTYMDLNSIAVSAGSACSAGSLNPSKVIEKMYNEERAKHSVRFSFGFKNTTDDVDEAFDVLKKLFEKRKND
ncbi:MAG: cysteine desulfurase family protein [Peptoniphilaceae bacterium]|nr:cysteine desulfurase [Peptoniphilaceae bacterium]MDD7383415.1 cysteine desulfurase family protein [Peptoniphilaceae bacterium]MDY3738810.1 cysteine desulfurase family protein [Peptoniphilaceae bacterium]